MHRDGWTIRLPTGGVGSGIEVSGRKPCQLPVWEKVNGGDLAASAQRQGTHRPCRPLENCHDVPLLGRAEAMQVALHRLLVMIIAFWRVSGASS